MENWSHILNNFNRLDIGRTTLPHAGQATLHTCHKRVCYLRAEGCGCLWVYHVCIIVSSKFEKSDCISIWLRLNGWFKFLAVPLLCISLLRCLEVRHQQCWSPGCSTDAWLLHKATATAPSGSPEGLRGHGWQVPRYNAIPVPAIKDKDEEVAFPRNGQMNRCSKFDCWTKLITNEKGCRTRAALGLWCWWWFLCCSRLGVFLSAVVLLVL